MLTSDEGISVAGCVSCPVVVLLGQTDEPATYAVQPPTKKARTDPTPRGWKDSDWVQMPTVETALDSITVRAGVRGVVVKTNSKPASYIMRYIVPDLPSMKGFAEDAVVENADDEASSNQTLKIRVIEFKASHPLRAGRVYVHVAERDSISAVARQTTDATDYRPEVIHLLHGLKDQLRSLFDELGLNNTRIVARWNDALYDLPRTYVEGVLGVPLTGVGGIKDDMWRVDMGRLTKLRSTHTQTSYHGLSDVAI